MQLAAPHVHPGCFSFSFFFFALVCLSLKLDYEIDTAEPEASHCLCARLLNCQYGFISRRSRPRARRARRARRVSAGGSRSSAERAGRACRPRAPARRGDCVCIQHACVTRRVLCEVVSAACDSVCDQCSLSPRKNRE